MFFVFLSHFAESYVRPNGKFELLSILYHITMVASPTFMLISGIVLGHLYEMRKDDFQPLKRTLIGRGLFLLTIGRVLIMLAHIPLAGGFISMLHWGFITDAIGVSVILGPLLIQRVNSTVRLVAGIGLFALSRTLVFTWYPTQEFMTVVKYLLFGPAAGYHNAIYADVFPIVPWFSVYLVGTCIGTRIGTLHVRGEMGKANAFILALASVTISFLVLGPVLIEYINVQSLEHITSSWPLMIHIEKLPPSLSYFLFYGGIGLLILYAYSRLESNSVVASIARFTGMIGQVSLFVFIVQYFVYFSLLVVLKLQYTVFWPLYFVASVFVVCVPSKLWYDRGLNKYLSVPYDKIWSRTKGLFGNVPRAERMGVR